MKRRACFVSFALLAGMLSAVALAAIQESTPLTPQQKRQYAVTVMRMINTAQVTHYHNAGRFAADPGDFTSGEINPARPTSTNPAFPALNLNAGADAVPGFKLRITVGQDGRSYAVKLNDAEHGSCGTDAFSDEVGVIYLAGPIDCNFSSLQPYNTSAQTYAGATASPQAQPYTGVMVSAQVQPDGAPSMVRVSAGVAEGNVLTKVDPLYPPLAVQARIQGDVVLQVGIATDGSVSDIKVVSGHPMMIQSAIDAVRQWRYKPYLLNGQPVAVMTQVTVPFRLQ